MNLDELKLLVGLFPFEPSEEDLEADEANIHGLYRNIVSDILTVLPNVYIAGLKTFRSGNDGNQVLMNELSALGFQFFDRLTEALYGIRVECMGSGFEREDLLNNDSAIHVTVQEIWQSLGLDGKTWNKNEKLAKKKHDNICELLMALIGERKVKENPTPLQAVGWFLAWCFSWTWNPLTDTLNEEVDENGFEDPWDEENLRTYLGLLEDQEKIMANVVAGHTLFVTHKVACMDALRMETEQCLKTLTLLLSCAASETEQPSDAVTTMVP